MQQEAASNQSTYPSQVVCKLLEDCERRLHNIEHMAGLAVVQNYPLERDENEGRYHDDRYLSY